jgi:hypothetical protein
MQVKQVLTPLRAQRSTVTPPDAGIQPSFSYIVITGLDPVIFSKEMRGSARA